MPRLYLPAKTAIELTHSWFNQEGLLAEDAHPHLHDFLQKRHEDLLEKLFFEGVKVNFLDEYGAWETSYFKAAVLPIFDVSVNYLNCLESDLVERILQFEENLYFQEDPGNRSPELGNIERSILEGQTPLLENRLVRAEAQWALETSDDVFQALQVGKICSVSRFLDRLKHLWFNPVQGASTNNILDYLGIGRALVPSLPWIEGQFRVQLILFRVVPEKFSDSIAAVDEGQQDCWYGSPLDEFRQGGDAITVPSILEDEGKEEP